MPKKYYLAAVIGGAVCLSSIALGQGVRPAAGRTEGLVGLWGTEQVIAPMVRGELTIDARGETWRATIAGFNVPVQQAKDRVRFTLPGGAGEFRGRMSANPARILGHWVQPGSINPYNQRYASPVELAEVSAKVWRGNVSPLEYRVSFYISIQPATDGTLTAFIRNPEANFFSGRAYKVEAKDDSVLLSHPIPEEGTFDREADRLSIPLLFSHPPLVFTRRTNQNAVGFFPRVAPESGRYVYKTPVPEDDGWATASLPDVGIDVRAIEAFVEKILVAAPTPENPLNIHSLLIARHGKLVLEEYFYGFDKNRTHDMRSASKTIAAVLVGIARDRGVKIGPDTPVYSLFPHYAPFTHWDQRKNSITVADLMNMASGLAVDDAEPASPGKEDRMQEQTGQPDWCKYTLDLPMARDPGGEHPVYGSANTNLVGCALRGATRRWLPELFEEYFARPLQIRTYQMNLMPNGEAYAGGGLYLRPRDQLKLGQLYLSGGVWNGHRVVSEAWVKRSTVRRGNLKPRMDIDVNHGYGYAWHFRDQEQGGRVFHYYWAGGNGGQLIIVIPELDLVVGFTGGDYGEFRKYLRWEIELLPQYILPAVKP